MGIKLVQLFLKSGETVCFYADHFSENEKNIEFYYENGITGMFRKYAVIGFCCVEGENDRRVQKTAD